METKIYKIYGGYDFEGKYHRQRESFFPSDLTFKTYRTIQQDFTQGEVPKEINGWSEIWIEEYNSDLTGSNQWTILKMTAENSYLIERELDGQISDGIFENSRVGKIEEITEEELQEILRNAKNN